MIVSNLLIVDANKTAQFVALIVTALKKEPERVQQLVIDIGLPDASFVGQNLLKELTSLFTTYVINEVSSVTLQALLLREYEQILSSLVAAKNMEPNIADMRAFTELIKVKRKRLNLTMMMLCDCVRAPDSYLNSHLFEYIEGLGEIVEVRAIAFKDLKNKKSPFKNSKDQSSGPVAIYDRKNLFQLWCRIKKGDTTES